MRLIYDHSPGAYAVRVACLTCGRMHTLADCTVDIDGTAFRAYYCERCTLPDAPLPASCNRQDCTRDHRKVGR